MTTPVKKVPIHLQSAQNRLLIKNGTVVNDDKSEQLDVYIEDSIIKQLGNHLIIPGGTRGNIELTFQLFFKMYTHNYFEYLYFQVIDASGKYVLPGGIDVDVHFETPFNEVCNCATDLNFSFSYYIIILKFYASFI